MSAHEPAGADPTLTSLGGVVSARAWTDRVTGSAEVREAFVPEQLPVAAVETVIAADKVLHLLEPRGVVDELLERLSRFVYLLVVHARGHIAIGVAVDVAVPLTGIQSRDVVEARIQLVDLGRGQRAIQHKIAAQIEQLDIEIGDHVAVPPLHPD